MLRWLTRLWRRADKPIADQTQRPATAYPTRSGAFPPGWRPEPGWNMPTAAYQPLMTRGQEHRANSAYRACRGDWTNER